MMTQSKIIQQADQTQQYEQNPVYYHRNINHQEVCNNITSIYKQVNSFVTHLNYAENKHLQNQNMHSSSKYKKYQKEYRVNQPKSQIDSIIINTQSLIQGLDWIKKDKLTNSSNFLDTQIQLSYRQNQNNHKGQNNQQNNNLMSQSLKKYSLNDNFNRMRKLSGKNSNNTQKYINKTVQIMPSTFNSQTTVNKKGQFQRSSVKIKPTTMKIYQKRQKQQPENDSVNVNKIFFNRFQKNNFEDFNQFDDKDTVVNQPIGRKNRKYHVVKTKNKNQYKVLQQSSMIDYKQNHRKLTKRKLYQKMQILQKQIQELKKQKSKEKTIEQFHPKELINHRKYQKNRTTQNQEFIGTKNQEKLNLSRKYTAAPSNRINDQYLTNNPSEQFQKRRKSNQINRQYVRNPSRQSYKNQQFVSQKVNKTYKIYGKQLKPSVQNHSQNQQINRKVIKSSLSVQNKGSMAPRSRSTNIGQNMNSQMSKKDNFINPSFQVSKGNKMQNVKKHIFKDNCKISLQKWVMNNI